MKKVTQAAYLRELQEWARNLTAQLARLNQRSSRAET
jgi:hypothetical protein